MITTKEQGSQKEANKQFNEGKIDFLRWIKEKGKVTVTDVVTWEDRENGRSFGPGEDGLKVLNHFVNLGVLGWDEEYNVVYKGFNDPKAPDPERLKFGPELGWDV